MTDNTPLGDQLVLAERHRILGLAAELERFGKLTAGNLRSFAEMRLEVSQPKVGVVETFNGDKIEYEIKQDVKVEPEPLMASRFEVGDTVLVSDDASNQQIPENWPEWVDVPCRIDVHNPNETDVQERKGGRHYLVYALDKKTFDTFGRWVSAEQMSPYILVEERKSLVESLGLCKHCFRDVSWDAHSVCWYHTGGGYYCDDTRRTSAEPKRDKP